jgi:spermidine synthase
MGRRSRAPVRRLLLLAFSGVLVQAAAAPRAHAQVERENLAGRLEYDGVSDYSHIRIRRRGDYRSLLFVRDNGEELFETKINLKAPHVLQFEYLKHLFTSYLFRPEQKDVLIVGLGGGAMVHFLNKADPALRVDVVEIDPVVVKLADEYFGVRGGGNVAIVTADGLKFIAEPQSTKAYDVIYIDAFLKPSADTDSTGVPLSLRTQEFYKQLQKKLKPGGVVAFNINPHANEDEEAAAMAAAFPQIYRFELPPMGVVSQGAVVIASTDANRVDPRALLERATAMERRFDRMLKFREMARRLRRE